MATIAMCNLKGGTGKTTSSILIGEGLRRRGKTVSIIDLDPQGSATEWADAASDENTPLGFDVIPGNARSIRRLPAADFIIIDCPPGNAQLIDAAIAAADRVIIPVSPSSIEVDRMWDALELSGDTPATVLLTQAVLSTRSLAALEEALADDEINTFTGAIPRREAIRDYYRRRPGDLFGYQAIADTLIEEAAR